MCVHSVSTSCAVLLRECSVSISMCMYNDNQGLFQSFSQGANGHGFDLKWGGGGGGAGGGRGGQLLIIIFICNVNFDVF